MGDGQEAARQSTRPKTSVVHCMCLRWARRADFYDAMDRDIVYPNLGIY